MEERDFKRVTAVYGLWFITCNSHYEFVSMQHMSNVVEAPWKQQLLLVNP
jgi:hypothetical protein